MSQVTKRALEASLKNVLETKPFDKVTIKDITDDCGVNRMTFYYHFKDIYDLVEWIIYDDARKLIEDKPTYQTWQEGFLLIFGAVKRNQVYVDNIYRALGKERIENFIHPLVRNLVMYVLHELESNEKLSKEDESFIADYYTYAFTGILFQWIKGDMKQDPQEIIDKLARVIEGSAEAAIGRFRT